MMIMNMNDVGSMFPGDNPIEYSNLESGKAFIIVIIPIYFLPVEQPINVYKIQVKTKNISSFFDYSEFKPPVAKICIALMNHIPCMIIQEFGSIHWHNHFGNMPDIIEVFW